MIFTDPPATPVTAPVVLFTVAVKTLLLLHVPPVVPSVSVVLELTHTFVVPPIAAGNGFTVTVVVLVAVKPLPSVAVTV